MFRGVFDRFPKLRVAFMEAGCSWAPYWFGRMNEEWEMRGEVEAPMCKRKPIEYLKDGRIYFHAEDYEPLDRRGPRKSFPSQYLLRFRFPSLGYRVSGEYRASKQAQRPE